MLFRSVFTILLGVGFFYFMFQAAVAGDETFDPENMISRSEALEDIAVLAKALEDLHPGLYLYQDKTVWQQGLAAFKESVPETAAVQEFFLQTSLFVRQIRGGHTKLYRSEARGAEFVQDRILPVRPLIFEKRLFIDQILGDFPDIRGAEILKINGEPAAEILKRLTPFVEVDGYGEERKKRQLELDFGNIYALFSFYQETDIPLTIATRDGETREIVLLGLDLKAYNNWRRGLAYQNPLFRLEFFDDKKTAYLDVGLFWNRGDETFIDFIPAAFAEIKKRDIEALIIDIRDNSGGYDTYGANLAQYLLAEPFRYFDKIEVTDAFQHEEGEATPPQEGKTRVLISDEAFGIKEPFADRFEGKLFVLINSKTFSTGADFAQTIHHNDAAIFLGEETSGGYFGNTSWAFEKLVLPHSGFQIRIPLGLYYKTGGGLPDGRGVQPDFVIARTPEDLKTNRDPVLEKALELASK